MTLFKAGTYMDIILKGIPSNLRFQNKNIWGDHNVSRFVSKIPMKTDVITGLHLLLVLAMHKETH